MILSYFRSKNYIRISCLQYSVNNFLFPDARLGFGWPPVFGQPPLFPQFPAMNYPYEGYPFHHQGPSYMAPPPGCQFPPYYYHHHPHSASQRGLSDSSSDEDTDTDISQKKSSKRRNRSTNLCYCCNL